MYRDGTQIPIFLESEMPGSSDHEPLVYVIDDEELLDAVRRALALDEANLAERAFNAQVLQRAALLTPREMDVFELAAQGRMIKQIAHEMGTQEVTVKVHKRHVMSKMQARTLIELAKMWELTHRAR